MLSVIFELRIVWYTNKGQTSSIVNEMKYSGISIHSPAGLYCVIKYFFYTGLQPNGTMPTIPLSYAPKKNG